MVPLNNLRYRKISSVGSGLIDYLIFAEDQLLVDLGIDKGGMTLVKMSMINDILKKAINKKAPIIVPGGSACNTAVGIGKLGAFSSFIGKLGNDKFGLFFERSLLERNVKPNLFYSDLPTGLVLSIITSDSQRTMLTYLGASSEILPEEITIEHFEKSDIIHVEGYLIFNPKLLIKILKCAKHFGALISFDLASFTVVEENLEILKELIDKYVDILIGNEDEAKAYTGCKDNKKIIRSMAKNTSIAVLKLGKRGSCIDYNGTFYNIEPFSIENTVDTTGAGDLWAAGFLFGIINEMSPLNCGKLASVCGAEVCKTIGANITNEGWNKIKNILSLM